MSIRAAIKTDVVLSPFGADAGALVDAARCLDDSGFDGVWTYDHFSGAMLDRPWSRDCFTLLGAMAAVTSSIRVGPLVANIVNRHVAELASAASTLASLAPGRAVLGLGSGAGPGSRFAAEHTAIGRTLADGTGRRQHLVESIEGLRTLWSGGATYEGDFVRFDELRGVVGPNESVRVIVGASGEQTIRSACKHADGVNIRVTPSTENLVALAQDLAVGRGFEISVHADIDSNDPLGGDVRPWIDAGVARRTLAMMPPFDLEAIATLGDRLNA